MKNIDFTFDAGSYKKSWYVTPTIVIAKDGESYSATCKFLKWYAYAAVKVG